MMVISMFHFCQQFLSLIKNSFVKHCFKPFKSQASLLFVLSNLLSNRTLPPLLEQTLLFLQSIEMALETCPCTQVLLL